MPQLAVHEITVSDKAIDLAPQTVDFALPARAFFIKLYEDKFHDRLYCFYSILARSERFKLPTLRFKV